MYPGLVEIHSKTGCQYGDFFSQTEHLLNMFLEKIPACMYLFSY